MTRSRTPEPLVSKQRTPAPKAAGRVNKRPKASASAATKARSTKGKAKGTGKSKAKKTAAKPGKETPKSSSSDKQRQPSPTNSEGDEGDQDQDQDEDEDEDEEGCDRCERTMPADMLRRVSLPGGSWAEWCKPCRRLPLHVQVPKGVDPESLELTDEDMERGASEWNCSHCGCRTYRDQGGGGPPWCRQDKCYDATVS